MSKPQSFGDSQADWQAMVANLIPHLPDLPHLVDDAGALAAVVARCQGLDSERALSEANLRRIHRERREAAREGRELRNRIAACLRYTLGFKNQALLQFGVKPRPEKARHTGLTALEKAQRAADRAVRKVAEIEAKQANAAAKRSTARTLPS